MPSYFAQRPSYFAQMGFGPRWRQWVMLCLENARSFVLINGSLTHEFEIQRGLRQGDPLSPFLFLIVMEGLHLMLRDGVIDGRIHIAKGGNPSFDVSHLFYADDAMVVSEWCLEILKINMSKSNIYGVGVKNSDIDAFILDSWCAGGTFPFTYLGLPIGVNLNRVGGWKTLIERFKKRLAG
ncbi:uncharacterized mitochondrial protein AtMg01250-like [Rutidosis leptorrhynchoides]|uniref:uncharacterized mitochondrial protein AtMg01250-like n=1 Tax=Rutidosis leptorrhynchoides TaxID=125765 RepID=UPI003A999ED0